MSNALRFYRAVIVPILVAGAFLISPATTDVKADLFYGAVDPMLCEVHNFTAEIKYNNYQHNPIVKDCK